MAKTKDQLLRNELRIMGVSEKTKQELKNIAKNLGITISQYLRPKLREIADGCSEDLKKPPVDY